MQKIIAALIAAIAFVTGAKANTTALQAEIAKRDQNITDLQTALADEKATDATLQAALEKSQADQKAAEDSLAAVNADIEAANAKADELTTAINADAAIPVEVNNGVARATNPGA